MGGQVTYAQQDERLLNDTLPIPPDLVRWWRRATSERGTAKTVLIIVPHDRNSKIKWTFLGSGKLENEE